MITHLIALAVGLIVGLIAGLLIARNNAARTASAVDKGKAILDALKRGK